MAGRTEGTNQADHFLRRRLRYVDLAVRNPHGLVFRADDGGGGARLFGPAACEGVRVVDVLRREVALAAVCHGDELDCVAAYAEPGGRAADASFVIVRV